MYVYEKSAISAEYDLLRTCLVLNTQNGVPFSINSC